MSGTQFCLHADPGTCVPHHTPSAGGPVSTGEERRAGRKQGRGSGTDKPSSSNPTSSHPCCHIPRIQVLLTRLQPVACGSGVFNARLLPDSRPLDPHDGLTSVWEHGAQILAEKCLSWQVGMLHPKKQKLCSRAVFTGFTKQVLVQKVFSGLWCLGQHGSLRRCVAGRALGFAWTEAASLECNLGIGPVGWNLPTHIMIREVGVCVAEFCHCPLHEQCHQKSPALSAERLRSQWIETWALAWLLLTGLPLPICLSESATRPLSTCLPLSWQHDTSDSVRSHR